MCCLFASMVLIGPRAAILVWWLIDSARWEAAFANFFWAFAGFFVAPWTTLAWTLVAHNGATGFDWFWLGFGILADLGSWGSGAWSRRGTYTPAT
ncbi:MAG: hypothetical protein U9N56_09420 [Actinomycetota bacterium]|nr:hypothetical protein [Actinomycetota bacterium]